MLDDANSYASCFSAKSAGEHIEACTKVMEKVHSILKSLNIPAYGYDDKLTELQDNSSELGDCLKWIRLKVSNLDVDLSKCKFRNEERRLTIEKLELDIVRINDDVCILNSENRMLMKQRNIFFAKLQKDFTNILLNSMLITK